MSPENYQQAWRQLIDISAAWGSCSESYRKWRHSLQLYCFVSITLTYVLLMPYQQTLPKTRVQISPENGKSFYIMKASHETVCCTTKK